MTRGDVARLLAYVAAFDRRTLGDADVLAWFDVLGDLDYDDAKAAVRDWYAEESGWIMPAHIRTRAIGRRGSADRHPSARPLAELIRALPAADPALNDRGRAAARAAITRNRTAQEGDPTP